MSVMTRWNPFKSSTQATAMMPSFENLFRDFISRPVLRDLEMAPDIRIDVSEDDKFYTVTAEIPGVDKNDIAVTIDGDEVAISAESKRETESSDKSQVYSERAYGRSFRSFTLPTHVDKDKVDAKYDKGVLKLTLPKMGNGSRKTIAVS
jgi:HSP20 family protein